MAKNWTWVSAEDKAKIKKRKKARAAAAATRAATKPVTDESQQVAQFGFNESFLRAHPEIKNLINDAIDGQWNDATFIGKLHDTKWWRHKSDAQRNYDVMRNTNPGQLSRLRGDALISVRTMASQLGVGLSYKSALNWADRVVRENMNEDELRMRFGNSYVKSRHEGVDKGQAGQVVTFLRQNARDMGVPISNAFLTGRVRQVLSGRATQEQELDYLREMAAKNYSGVASQIRAGMTVREIMDPFLQIAQQELGVPAANLQLAPKWTAALQYHGADGKGPERAMTFDEWTRKIRSDQQYGWDKTTGAHKAASSLLSGILERFGKAE